jgi:hypothetical protein
MNAWLIVTRISFDVFVGQLAWNAGVEKKPTRGVFKTSSVALRRFGMCQNGVRPSVPFGARTFTSVHVEKSFAVIGPFAFAPPLYAPQLPLLCVVGILYDSNPP